eukprot:sb/3475703/
MIAGRTTKSYFVSFHFLVSVLRYILCCLASRPVLHFLFSRLCDPTHSVQQLIFAALGLPNSLDKILPIKNHCSSGQNPATITNYGYPDMSRKILCGLKLSRSADDLWQTKRNQSLKKFRITRVY